MRTILFSHAFCFFERVIFTKEQTITYSPITPETTVTIRDKKVAFNSYLHTNADGSRELILGGTWLYHFLIEVELPYMILEGKKSRIPAYKEKNKDNYIENAIHQRNIAHLNQYTYQFLLTKMLQIDLEEIDTVIGGGKFMFVNGLGRKKRIISNTKTRNKKSRHKHTRK
jgi:hypothetical protein